MPPFDYVSRDPEDVLIPVHTLDFLSIALTKLFIILIILLFQIN